MTTRIIVVVWTTLCLAIGMLAGGWLMRPRVIDIEPFRGSLLIHPVVRTIIPVPQVIHLEDYPGFGKGVIWIPPCPHVAPDCPAIH
jgi:hypothetical protein